MSTEASPKRLFRVLLVVWLLVLCMVGALGAEFGARYYERHRSTPPDFFPQMYYPHRRLRYGLVPNYDYYGWFKINSLGFRGSEVAKTKPSGVLRIACLGGSTTFDIGSVGRSRPWPEVLQAELQKSLPAWRVEVLNVGIPGATSLDSLIDMQTRVLALQPDMIVVYQGHNDFFYSMPGPAPAASSLYPGEAPPRSGFIRWLRMHSVLFAKTEGRVSERIGALWHSMFRSDRQSPAQTEGEASLENGLASFRNNVTSIAASARANGIPLVLPRVILPFPSDAAADCGVCARLSPLLANIPAPEIEAMFQRYDDVLRGLEGVGVYHVDTSGFVPSEDRYYHDPVHFGPRGSERMGERMAHALLSLFKSGVGVGGFGNGETKLP